MWGQAIAGLPGCAAFYSCRGEVLAQLGKEREAVVVSALRLQLGQALPHSSTACPTRPASLCTHPQPPSGHPCTRCARRTSPRA